VDGFGLVNPFVRSENLRKAEVVIERTAKDGGG